MQNIQNETTQMIATDERLKDFFIDEIFNDDDEVDSFLSQYDCDSVVQCLFVRLKSLVESPPDIAYIADTAWRLGRTFAAIPKKYSVDIKMYSLLESCNDFEKMGLLNFLSGYWDGTKSDLNTVSKLFDTLVEIISNKIEWSKRSVLFGIEAVSTGYSSFRQRSVIDTDLEDEFIEKLNLFKLYLSSFPEAFPGTTEMLDFIESLSKKII
jgi:hypothetical protein